MYTAPARPKTRMFDTCYRKGSNCWDNRNRNRPSRYTLNQHRKKRQFNVMTLNQRWINDDSTFLPMSSNPKSKQFFFFFLRCRNAAIWCGWNGQAAQVPTRLHLLGAVWSRSAPLSQVHPSAFIATIK